MTLLPYMCCCFSYSLSSEDNIQWRLLAVWPYSADYFTHECMNLHLGRTTYWSHSDDSLQYRCPVLLLTYWDTSCPRMFNFFNDIPCSFLWYTLRAYRVYPGKLTAYCSTVTGISVTIIHSLVRHRSIKKLNCVDVVTIMTAWIHNAAMN